MNATFKAAALLAATCLLFGVAQAATKEASESGTEAAPAKVEKTDNVIERGAKATASGIERGTKAAVRGVKRGAKAAAKGIEHGAQATGRAANRVAEKIGITDAPEAEGKNAKP